MGQIITGIEFIEWIAPQIGVKPDLIQKITIEADCNNIALVRVQFVADDPTFSAMVKTFGLVELSTLKQEAARCGVDLEKGRKEWQERPEQS